MMLKLSDVDIIKRIQDGSAFECYSLDCGLYLKIESYTPVICTAIHAGKNMRSKILEHCALNDSERLYEEDPYTDQLIQAMPITLVGMDSRYEYDLNRPISSCIYNTAWGKKVWSKKLTPKYRSESIQKHQSFYRVLDSLITVIEERFGASLIFDIHSYNYLRRDDLCPTFNLGTEQIDKDRWGNIIDHTLKTFSRVELPNMPVSILENSVFFGRGYLSSHVYSRFQNSLVLPLEIKKVFMDELSGSVYPLVMQAMGEQFKLALIDISALFSRRHTAKKRVKKSDMLTEKMDPSILQVDRELYQLAKGLETLYYINPINIPAEKKHFFKRNGDYLPQFRYRQLNVDPYRFRESLYRLPVDSIRDPSIQALYRNVIDGLSEKIGMLVKAGHPDFIYESLKYYGEPSLLDEKNARFLLHASTCLEIDEPLLDEKEIFDKFTQAAKEWNMDCKVEISSKIVASAMVSNARKTVIIAKGLKLTSTEANALIHHELGVHMATTINANKQRLKVFSLGLPGNTLTQEGLAILNEYHSGNMTLKRMQGLALRVLAVKEMMKYGDFRHTYSYLHEEHKLSEEQSFKLALRVHRAGGFTKDFLYLNGVSQALNLAKINDLSNLYIGKTGFEYLALIDEMIERQLVSSPQFVSKYLAKPAKPSVVLEYLMGCVRYDSKFFRESPSKYPSVAA